MKPADPAVGRADTGGAGARRTVVLHVIHTMAYGGVETAVLNWVRSFDLTRYDVHLACFANPGGTEQPFIDAAQRLGLTVSTLPWHRGKPVWRAARALQRLVQQHGIQIVHAHNCYADVVVWFASRLGPARFKTITTAYVWFDFGDWKRNLIQWIDARAMRRFDRVTAHCETTRVATLERGIATGEVPTLICGFETHPVRLDAQQRREGRAAHGADDTDVVLLNVARLYPEKAQDFLLEVFARLLIDRPRLMLWLAGVGPLEGALREKAQQLGVAHRVRFLGFVAPLPPMLALADLQVHPAHIEGVPLAICEGMAAGLPIVASEVGGLPEILDGGRNGVLVPGLEIERFAQAVAGLIDEPVRAAGYGAKARRFIEEDYSLTRAVGRVEAEYDRLLAC
jgi:glycosyltransferase involved in cell wall biosynthesis